MGKTSYSTSSNETKKLWDIKTWLEASKEIWWSKFFGSNDAMNSPVYINEDLTKSKGDRVRLTLRMRLNPKDYKTEGQTMLNNEQKLSTYTDDITLGLYRWAVRDDGIMTRQRAVFDVPAATLSSLKVMTAEGVDQLCFDEMYNSPTDFFYLASGLFSHTTTAATATSAITATDKINPNLILKIKPFLITGNNRARTPIMPFKIDGNNYHVVLVSPNVATDWRLDSEVKEMLRMGMPRDASNPIFTGALGAYQGFVFHENENVPTYSTGGAGGDVVYSHCKILGSGALGIAWGASSNGTTFDIVQEDIDYKNEEGYCARIIAGFRKIQYNSKDYGSASLICATTNYSGV